MTPFIGQIMMFAGNFAPRGWAFCDGQLLPIANYTALFSIIGTTYGGDGKTTFALPDMRGRVAINPGQGPGLSNYIQGPGAGHENVTLTTSNMPPHNHALNVKNANGTTNVPANNALAGTGTALPPAGNFSTEAPDAQANNTSIGNTGGSIPFSVVQPWVGIRFVIALEGVFPSRG